MLSKLCSSFSFVFKDDEILGCASAFERYLTRIDPHTLSKDDRVYIITHDMKRVDVAYYISDVDGLMSEESLWILNEEDILVYNLEEINPIGDSVYVIIGDPKIEPNIKDNHLPINTIYNKYGNPDIIISINKLYVKDIEVGDLIMNDWTYTLYVHNKKYNIDTNTVTIDYENYNNLNTSELLSYDTVTILRLKLLGG